MSESNRRETDGLQALVRAFGEAMYNTPGDRPTPSASTDVVEVVKGQLTESTGTHFLDSGMDNGRAWQKNRETPPWERPEWAVSDGWVTHNVYHYMTRIFTRDRLCVALETALYANYEGTPTHGDAIEFAEDIGSARYGDLIDISVPEELADDVAGFAAEQRRNKREPIMAFNTYNGDDCHGLSQDIQVVNIGGPYADYAIVETHNGADIRGGYSGPRVYHCEYGPSLPLELSFWCDECGIESAESCRDEVKEAVEFLPDENECRCKHCGGEVLFS